VEVKSRSSELDGRWIKDQIRKASDQVKQSGADEQGAVELQLRGDDAARAPFDAIERQVKAAFNDARGTRLNRVTVFKDGVKVGEWRRLPDGSVERVFPP
jgi:hypothetical protein